MNFFSSSSPYQGDQPASEGGAHASPNSSAAKKQSSPPSEENDESASRPKKKAKVSTGLQFPDSRPRQVERNFVVLGATGSGKTSLIQALVSTCQEDLEKEIGGLSARWHTEKCETYTSSEIRLNDHRATFSFLDSVGFGAQGQSSVEIVGETFKSIMENTMSLNGIIVVHNAGRYRESYDTDLKIIKSLLAEYEVDHSIVTLVITHTGMLTEEVQEAYSEGLLSGYLNQAGSEPFVKKENTVHVNFPRLDELREPFKTHFSESHLDERMKFLTFLEKFKTSFNPSSIIIRKTINYDNIIKKLTRDQDQTSYLSALTRPFKRG